MTMFDHVTPHVVREAVLPPDALAELLAFTLDQEAQFAPSTLRAGRIDSTFRASRALPGTIFKPWRARFRSIVAALAPDLLRELGMPPCPDATFECELVRHNDGDFYRRHIDTELAASDQTGTRVLSMVYYFHAESKAYSGGALRLWSFRHDAAYEDIAPGQNRLVAFPSWGPHEVLPIACPSRRFIDSRFAVNCWLWRETSTAQS